MKLNRQYHKLQKNNIEFKRDSKFYIESIIDFEKVYIGSL